MAMPEFTLKLRSFEKSLQLKLADLELAGDELSSQLVGGGFAV